MNFVRLEEASVEKLYGGKAVQLGAALRAGLPVPPGFALAYCDVEALLAAGMRPALQSTLASLGDFVAVRSSGVGEDSETASFAGQHATVLGVRTAQGMLDALTEVLASARTDSALAYRKKLGLDPHPKMGVVVQKLVLAETAGVLFSRHPISGADERVIEASWGLGEVVVQGLVTPDRYRLARGGRVLERSAGEKDLAIRWSGEGGTREEEVAPELVNALCLDDEKLARLEALAARCESVFGGSQDLEFAFEGGALFLLQRRAISKHPAMQG